MKCPNCNKEIPSEAKFCLHCGTKVEVDASIIECPSCHARIPKDSKFCPDCGGKINIEDDKLTIEVEGVKFTMIRVSKGSFYMGAKPGCEYRNESCFGKLYQHSFTQQLVHIDYDFYISETLVSQDLWTALMSTNPSDEQYPHILLPVCGFNQDQMNRFLSRLNTKTALKFRIPTEVEWEFAARGGIKSKGYKYPGTNDYNMVAGRIKGTTSRYELKKHTPNELGIYDFFRMKNQVCYDSYDSNQHVSTIIKNGYTFRGGVWDQASEIEYRWAYNLFGSYDIGLRLVLEK